MFNNCFNFTLCVFLWPYKTLATESPTRTISQWLSKIVAIFFEYAVKLTILDLFFSLKFYNFFSFSKALF